MKKRSKVEKRFNSLAVYRKKKKIAKTASKLN